MFFSNIVKEKVNEKKNNRYDSINSFIDYLQFLGFIGRVDEIYFSLRFFDKVYIDDNERELIKHGVYNALESLVNRIESYDAYNIKEYILTENNSEISIYNFISNLLAELDSKSASHEENLILSFLLNITISKNLLNNELAIKLVNYYYNTKNCNRYRRDYCIFSIVDFCIDNNNSFFKLRKQYYNHIQKIHSRIHKSPFLTSSEKAMYQIRFSSQIKKSNKLKSKTKNRVAVCFSGLYRNHIEAVKSIKENVIDPLNADVFIHTWDEKAIWSGVGGTPLSHRLFGSADIVIPKEIKNLLRMENYLPRIFDRIKSPIVEKWDGREITDILNPKKILIENQKVFEESLEDKENYLQARGSFNQIKMFYGIKKSFDLALEYSDYDYIVRIRPDILVDNKISIDDISNLENNTIYTNVNFVGPHEFEFILSSSVAYNLSSFIGKMFDFKVLSPYESFPLYCSHTLMLSWMIEFNYVQDKSLLSRSLMNMSERKISIKDLDYALEEDLKNLSEDDKVKFSPFLSHLKNNFC